MKRYNSHSEKFPTAIGYWTTDTHPSLPEPFDFVDPTISFDLRNIVAAYLERGKPFIGMLGFSSCRFKCGIEDHHMGSFCFTDGDYIWPEGLSHYVRKHNVWFPRIFIDHILKDPNKDLTQVNLDKLDFHDFSWWETTTLY